MATSRSPALRFAFFAVFAVALAACAGGSRGGSPLPSTPNQPADRTATESPEGVANAHGRLVITLPVIVPPNVLPSASALSAALSSATLSVAGTFGNRKIGPIALTAQNPACTTATDGLHCIVSVSEPTGTSTLKLATFASANGTGAQLAACTPLSATVYPGLHNAVTPLWSGRASTYRLALSARRLQQGVAKVVAVTLYAIDAGNAVIPSTNVVDASGKQVYWLGAAAAPYASSFQYEGGPFGYLPYTSENFDYDGITAAAAKIQAIGAAGGGEVVAKATVRVQAAAATPAQIFSWTGNTLEQTTLPVLLQFGASSSGNVPPLRSWQLNAPAVTVNADGSFWSGPYVQDAYPNNTTTAQEYSASGSLLAQVSPSPASVEFLGAGLAADANNNLYAVQASDDDYNDYGPPTLTEYSAASSWKTVVRQIALPGTQYGYAALAFDPQGDVYVGLNSANGQILEYGPTQSGSATPIRTISLPIGQEQAYVAQSISVDSSGNLYTFVRGITGIFLGQLLEYAPGATTPTYPAYPFGRINAFALDDQDDAYIEGSPGTTGQYVIEEFAPGSTTPMRTIGGSNTLLPVPGPYYQQIGLVIAPSSASAAKSPKK